MDSASGTRFSLNFQAIPPLGLFEFLQTLVLRQAQELRSVYPPVVFKHLVVVSWGEYSLRIQLSNCVIFVDILSGSEGASTVLTAFQGHLKTLAADFFHGREPWSLRVHGWVGNGDVSTEWGQLHCGSRQVACWMPAASECEAVCDIRVFAHWLRKPQPLACREEVGEVLELNWCYAKLGMALSSAYFVPILFFCIKM